ncbi:dihydrofolate reductase [Sciscionella marina]|uniref:dihydrofolate reductase n=1 Tax=Sciscionella marina TaxID=508770 RepID=UPI000362CD8F|nr:dihydrofolate reductase [Sciscionella marina]
MTEIGLVAAVAENGVLGDRGGMPWKLPGDLARFKRFTLGHPIIMGRRTFESIGRPLPGRRNLVLSMGSGDPRVEWFSSLDQAVAAAGPGRAFVIGGATVYRAALPFADLVHLTRVHASPEGDTVWEPDLSAFTLAESTRYTEDEIPCTVELYRR